jgi:hypothetical protein
VTILIIIKISLRVNEITTLNKEMISMIHGYTSKREMMNMYQNGRQAIIVTDVATKDIDEFITGYITVASNNGCRMDQFTQPKIISNRKNGTYDICLIYRKDIKIDKNTVENTANILSSISPSRSLEKYIRYNLVGTYRG